MIPPPDVAVCEPTPLESAMSPGPFQLVDFSSALAATADPGEVAERFLDGSSGSISATAVLIRLFSDGDGEGPCVKARGVGHEFLDRYERIGKDRDPVLQEALRRGGPVETRMLVSRDLWTSLPVFEEVFGLHDLTEVLVTPLVVRSEPVGTLHFMRRRGEPAFQRRDLVAAKAMARIVLRAVLAARQATERRRERACLWAAVECASDAMVMRQDSSDVLYVNSAARRLIGEVRDGERLISEAGRGEGYSSRIVIPRSGEGPAFVKIRTHRAPHDPSILVSVIEFVEGALAASPGARPLTRRELEVGELAARGMRVADIADHLVLSPHTVKQHLKSCYAKLGVHSRVGLARQLA